MKKLLLLWLFSGSLDGFTQELKPYPITPGMMIIPSRKPDTLRATLIVYYDNGPAILHTKPGFVVLGKETVYLDDRKRVIKAPWQVFTYKVKK